MQNRCLPAYAQNNHGYPTRAWRRFTGRGGNTLWNTATNWQYGIVPRGDNKVVMDGLASGHCTIDSITASLRSCFIQPSYVGHIYNMTGIFICSGTFYFNGGGSITATGGTFHLEHDIYLFGNNINAGNSIWHLGTDNDALVRINVAYYNYQDSILNIPGNFCYINSVNPLGNIVNDGGLAPSGAGMIFNQLVLNRADIYTNSGTICAISGVEAQVINTNLGTIRNDVSPGNFDIYDGASIINSGGFYPYRTRVFGDHSNIQGKISSGKYEAEQIVFYGDGYIRNLQLDSGCYVFKGNTVFAIGDNGVYNVLNDYYSPSFEFHNNISSSHGTNTTLNWYKGSGTILLGGTGMGTSTISINNNNSFSPARLESLVINCTGIKQVQSLSTLSTRHCNIDAGNLSLASSAKLSVSGDLYIGPNGRITCAATNNSIQVTGNFSMIGVSGSTLEFAMLSGILNCGLAVVGTSEAIFARIRASDASRGQTGFAYASTNLGGNTNWVFYPSGIKYKTLYSVLKAPDWTPYSTVGSINWNTGLVGFNPDLPLYLCGLSGTLGSGLFVTISGSPPTIGKTIYGFVRNAPYSLYETLPVTLNSTGVYDSTGSILYITLPNIGQTGLLYGYIAGHLITGKTLYCVLPAIETGVGVPSLWLSFSGVSDTKAGNLPMYTRGI